MLHIDSGTDEKILEHSTHPHKDMGNEECFDL
jgi:hypothetical protein